MLIVLPGSVNHGGARSGNGGASTLTIADGLAIAQLPHVAAVSPTVTVRAQVVAGGNNWQTTVTGVAPTYTFIRNWPIATGHVLRRSEMASSAKIAVLGQTVVAESVSGRRRSARQNDPDPQRAVRRRRHARAKGQSGVGQDQDDTILIPYTSALERLTGRRRSARCSCPPTIRRTSRRYKPKRRRCSKQRHRIAPGTPDDFTIRNLQDIANAASATASVMQLLLAGVAAVSLLVGGIGIMNIMLVSVTERTREIGLRVAVGARRAAILWQFLIEAVVLATAGGGARRHHRRRSASLAVAFGAHWPATRRRVAAFALSPSRSRRSSASSSVTIRRAKAVALDPIVALRFE